MYNLSKYISKARCYAGFCYFMHSCLSAYEEIVKNHLEKYPNDEEFKKNVARAYLVYGNTFYENSNTPGSYIPNAQAYKMVKMSAEKAVEMHRDEETESALHATISRGKIEFNKDNLKGIAPFWAICLIFILIVKATDFCPITDGIACP